MVIAGEILRLYLLDCQRSVSLCRLPVCGRVLPVSDQRHAIQSDNLLYLAAAIQRNNDVTDRAAYLQASFA